jgi:hypothetical protein
MERRNDDEKRKLRECEEGWTRDGQRVGYLCIRIELNIKRIFRETELFMCNDIYGE